MDTCIFTDITVAKDLNPTDCHVQRGAPFPVDTDFAISKASPRSPDSLATTGDGSTVIVEVSCQNGFAPQSSVA